MRRIAVLLCALAAVFSLTGCVDQSADGDVQDTAEEEQRIVATSVAICNILDALEVDAENVVGIPKTSYDLPEQYSDITLVGAPMSPDMEIVATLNPTIILSPVSLEGSLAAEYDNIGANYYFMDLNSTVGMFESIQKLGEMVGKEEKALQMQEEFESYLDEFEASIEGKEAPSVLILMGLPNSYIVATEKSYVGSLVKLTGAENVYADEEEDFVNINSEDMLQRQPDIILLTAHALPDQVAIMFEEEFAENDIWQHFAAVQNEQVYTLDHNYFGMSANLEYEVALEQLKEILYP